MVLAGAKVALGLILYLAGAATRSPQFAPVWVYASLSAAFAGLGTLLLVGNRRDVRAAWLGGVFLLIAAPLTPIVNQLSAPDPPAMAFVRPEAIWPAFVWSFVGQFPTPLTGPLASWIRAAAVAAGAVGMGSGLALLSLLVPGDATATPWRQFATSVAAAYWPAMLGVTLPAFPAMLWRAKTAPLEARPRVWLFVRGLLVGLLPFVIEVIAEAASPAYNEFTSRPAVRPVVATILFGALASVPFVTAYSVLFDRVVETRVVLRAALQHALARYMVLGAVVVPFAALILFIIGHREERLVTLMTGARPVLLFAAAGAGLAALGLRHRWLDAIDRRYFREPYDAQRILTNFVGELKADSHEALAAQISRELDRALHTTTDVYLVNDAHTAIRDVSGRREPLAAASTILGLVLNDPRPMDVDLAASEGVLTRLPDVEKQWLAANGVRLLVALKSGDGRLTGALALAEKRSGLRYSIVDRQLISAVAAAASLALDNLRLRSTPPSPSEPAAQECLRCSRLNPPESLACQCGGAVALAHVPHILRGTFRLEHRLGVGGMGVVYRALDLSLGRHVAIKTLPRIGAAQATRLRREARAMAMVAHEHLAVVHGVETWRDVPFVIEEYLSGGTLADRLSTAPLSVREAADLGVRLATALEQMHASGLLHCDIKPSNIGFTARGVVKLMDFGLARVLRDAQLPANLPTTTATGPAAPAVPPSNQGVLAGTPHYMSPEAVRGLPPSTTLDIWGLSVVLYEAIAGRRPFEGDSAAEIFARIVGPDRPDLSRDCPGCPTPVVTLFANLLAREPERRPPDATTLRHQLEPLRLATAST